MSDGGAMGIVQYYSAPVKYNDALQIQENAVQACAKDGIPRLFVLQHPHVVTIGKDAKQEDRRLTDEELVSQGIDVHHVTRGGSFTYHGPGQLVAYPIMCMARGREQVQYVDTLQQTIVDMLDTYGIHSDGSRDRRHPGVFTEEGKIAAIGVEFRSLGDGRIVSMHGAAIYVRPDHYFDCIFPCGDKTAKLTSMEKELGWAPDMHEARARFVEKFSQKSGIEFTVSKFS